MATDSKSITDWNRLALESPERAARLYLEQVDAIPQEKKKRVFAALPDFEDLLESFERAQRDPSKPLAGVPYLLKDLYDFPGYPTTASSSFLTEVRPTPHKEAALSQAFRANGAVFAGKTHLNEFAYGLSGENLTFGDCPHPLFPERVSGGSSSGSAWAVKSGIAPIATGTDTAGSIRVPAAWCGLWGIRFAPNAWSRNGCFPLAPKFDTAGWLTATSQDMATAIRSLVPLESSETGTPKGLSLMDAVPNLSDCFRARCADTIRALDVTTNPETLQSYLTKTKDSPFSYAVLQSMDAYSVHEQWVDEYKNRYDPVVWQRLDRARHWSDGQIERAIQAEQSTQHFFAQSFEEYDYLVIPATQSPAITAAAHTDRFRNELIAITAPASVGRIPVLTIPIQLKNGETQGLQILYRDENSDLPLRIIQALSQG